MYGDGFTLRRGYFYMTKHVYISAYESAPIIGISRQAISKMVQRGTFIKGYKVTDKRLKRRALRYRLSDIELLAKSYQD